MANRWERDDDERNRGEFSGNAEFGGYYARDTHRGGMGDDYARDRGFSGGGAHDDHVRDQARDHDRSMSHRGKGPKNWDRSDERIRAVVNEHLMDHDGIDATHIEVTVDNAEVTLSGNVGSRWEKRLAEDIAFHCRGVHDVHNRLTVADRETQIGKASE
jgi:osmotically-inducible protein OsmY